MKNHPFENENLQQPSGHQMILRVKRLRANELKTQQQREVMKQSHSKPIYAKRNAKRPRRYSQVRHFI